MNHAHELFPSSPGPARSGPARPGLARRTAALCVASALVAGVSAAATAPASADPADTAGTAVAGPAPVSVTVDTNAGLGVVPRHGLGVNHAIWDAKLGSDETTALLREAGTQMTRYPGGSYGDIYHWETHTAPGGYVAPDTDFDTYVAATREAGAEPIVIANYGTGTAQEAAGWVRYANRTKDYDVRYWEIGNENYGNGHYGSAWEADDHPDKSPTAYAIGVVEYAAAMKAVDPSIKIGAVLTTPGNWPDGIVAEGDPATWNETVLSIAGGSIDYVILHWYPGGAGTADALAKPQQAADITALTRDLIAEHAGPRAGRIGIALTELNAGAGVNTQPGALFAADAYASLWSAGVFTVDWWNVHNGIGTVSEVAGHTDYGDFGLLSSGNCTQDGSVCQPAFNTPFAPYHAIDLLDEFSDTGDQLVQVTTSDPLVRGHAVRRPDGRLAVLLLNEDPDAARTVSLDYPGFAPDGRTPQVTRYLNGGTGLVRERAGTAGAQTLPPYSLTSILLTPRRHAGPAAIPRTPSVTGVTDSGATVTWPASRRAAAYRVYLRSDGVSRLAGTTSGTTLDVAGLDLGTRYTVTVVAEDRHGRRSWSSLPASFVTGTPADAACAVTLTKTGDWGNGYVGSLRLENTGEAAVDGWTLEFDLPRPWQSFGSGWNGTWSADGTRVTATDAGWNGSLAPGASAEIGYVGNYAGPNVLPRVFELNGEVCTTRQG